MIVDLSKLTTSQRERIPWKSACAGFSVACESLSARGFVSGRSLRLQFAWIRLEETLEKDVITYFLKPLG